MNEGLIGLPFIVKDAAIGTVATDHICQHVVPFPCTVVGLSVSLDVVSGTPTDTLLDFEDDGTEITGFADVSCGDTSLDTAQVKTPHLGGAVDVPAQIAADSVISMDLKFSAGSTPKAGVTAMLWVLKGEG